MRFASAVAAVGLWLVGSALSAPRQESKAADIKYNFVATNQAIDLQNPDSLARQPTDNGPVPNLKWSFSDSQTRTSNGAWAREQSIQDLPQSNIAGAQEHMEKGTIQALHWHRFAEWGFVYKGRMLLSAVDENGVYQTEELNYGDIWYFPKGVAHTLQGLEDSNEYLIVLDDGDINRAGSIFHVDDWMSHTPKDILAKNFGVPESTFDFLPSTHPYTVNGQVSEKNVTGAVTPIASDNNSFVYRTLQHPPEKVGSHKGVVYKIDSTTFPRAKTIAATYVTLQPGGLRELHWHPNDAEWLYFHQGTARATVFIGNSNARTYNFMAGDIAAFPENTGHYIENTGEGDLIFIEIFKSERVSDISLTQWLALTPPDIVAQSLKVPIEFVESLKKNKQVFAG
ncbi:putative oxalate decarboxylase oxdC [Trichoderma evansii]